MTRSLKALGLALVAVLALSAVVASVASAAHLTVGEYPAAISGQQIGEENEFSLPGGRTFTCAEVAYSGEYTEADAAASPSHAKVTPEYSNCTAEILGNVTDATVTVNGCFYEYTTDNFVTATTATGSVHLRCPAGQGIEIHIWQTHEKHTNNETPLCTYKIGEQTLGGEMHYEIDSEGPEHPHTYLTARGSALSVAVGRTGGTLTNCGAASQTASLTTEAKGEFTGGGGMLSPELES